MDGRRIAIGGASNNTSCQALSEIANNEIFQGLGVVAVQTVRLT